MMQNSKKNIIKLLNKIIDQDKNLLNEYNADEYVKEIQDYRFIIALLQDEKYFNMMAGLYELESEEE